MNKRTLNMISFGIMMTTLALAYLASSNIRHLSQVTSIPSWALIILVLILLDAMSITTIKRALVKAMEEQPTLKTVGIANYPQLDRQAFDYYDSELTGLGFERRFCYSSESQMTGRLQGLACVYYHPLHKCTAENGQIFKGNSRMAWAYVSTRFGDNWSLSNSNMKPNPIQCVLRKPRSLWKTIPGGGPRELLEAHLQLRQMISGCILVDNITPDTEQTYFESLIQNHFQNREMLNKKNSILLRLEMMLYKRKPICYWMGDLRSAIQSYRGL